MPLIVGVYMIKYGNISKGHIRDILRCKNENICLDFDPIFILIYNS